MGSMNFVNVGHGNLVAASRIVTVASPDSAPMKRLVQDAREEGRVIDVTGGKRTRAVLVADTGHIILCGLQTETVAARLNGRSVSADAEEASDAEEAEEEAGDAEEAADSDE